MDCEQFCGSIITLAQGWRKGVAWEEAFTSVKPKVSHFRIFGCKVYIHASIEKTTKLEPSEFLFGLQWDFKALQGLYSRAEEDSCEQGCQVWGGLCIQEVAWAYSSDRGWGAGSSEGWAKVTKDTSSCFQFRTIAFSKEEETLTPSSYIKDLDGSHRHWGMLRSM